MSEWILYVGEFAWRISRVPNQLEDESRDQRFYFRTYGLAVAGAFAALLLYVLVMSGSSLAAPLQALESAIGAELILLQIMVVLAGSLIIGIPLLLVALLFVASIVGFVAMAVNGLVVIIRSAVFAGHGKHGRRSGVSPKRRSRKATSVSSRIDPM